MNICPICTQRSKRLCQLKGSRTHKWNPLFWCVSCDFLFQRPGYSENDDTLKADNEWHKERQAEYAPRIASVLKRALNRVPKAKSLLDIGCGIGTTLLEGRKLGLNCFGIEPNPYSCTYARDRGIDIKEGYLSRSSFDSKFDIVVADSVIEHVPDPSKFLRTALSYVREGGVLYLSYPGNKWWLINIVFSLVFLRHPRGMFNDNDVHINHFSDRTLKVLIGKNHTKVVETVRKGAHLIKRI